MGGGYPSPRSVLPERQGLNLHYTRGELLREAICFALGKCKIQGRKGVLSDSDRQAIARAVIENLRQHGDRWNLDAPVEVDIRPTWDWSRHGK